MRAAGKLAITANRAKKVASAKRGAPKAPAGRLYKTESQRRSEAEAKLAATRRELAAARAETEALRSELAPVVQQMQLAVEALTASGAEQVALEQQTEGRLLELDAGQGELEAALLALAGERGVPRQQGQLASPAPHSSSPAPLLPPSPVSSLSLSPSPHQQQHQQQQPQQQQGAPGLDGLRREATAASAALRTAVAAHALAIRQLQSDQRLLRAEHASSSAAAEARVAALARQVSAQAEEHAAWRLANAAALDELRLGARQTGARVDKVDGLLLRARLLGAQAAAAAADEDDASVASAMAGDFSQLELSAAHAPGSPPPPQQQQQHEHRTTLLRMAQAAATDAAAARRELRAEARTSELSLREATALALRRIGDTSEAAAAAAAAAPGGGARRFGGGAEGTEMRRERRRAADAAAALVEQASASWLAQLPALVAQQVERQMARQMAAVQQQVERLADHDGGFG